MEQKLTDQMRKVRNRHQYKAHWPFPVRGQRQSTREKPTPPELDERSTVEFPDSQNVQDGQ